MRARQPTVKDGGNRWYAEKDEDSQLKGLAAAGTSLHLIQRGSESHRIGTFMEFDSC